MANTGELDLRQQIEQLNAEQLATAPAEELATIQKAIEALIASGMVGLALQKGAKAPDFTLPNAVGRPYRLADGLARGPVVVTFYRGGWCPYCNLQLRVYQQILPQIHALGATLVAISPQSPDQSQAVLLNNFLQYEVLSDLGNNVGRAYGLVYPVAREMQRLYLEWGVDLAHYNADKSWELPLPGTFVIDRDFTVQLAFVDADYTRRLDPADILAALLHISQS